MADNKQAYNQGSIKTLKDEQQVRQRPSVIFGTNDEEGAAHGVYEIIANAIDEAREGYGKQIRIKIWEDGAVEVSDDGRGAPMDWSESEKEWNWKLVFSTLYASGKYDSNAYGQALGLNGLGATAMQYASEYFNVNSIYNGLNHEIHFKQGRPIGKLEVTPAADPTKTGTTIKFKPDPSVFIGIKNNCMPHTYYVDILRRQAMLHAGLEFKLWYESADKELSIVYPDGIKGFISLTTQKPMLKEPIEFIGSATGTDDPERDEEPYKFDMRIAFNFSREIRLTELYHNGSNLFEGGVTLTALQWAFVHAFNDKAHELGKIGKNEQIQYRDIDAILVAVANTDAPGNRTYFKNQTKGAVNNPFMREAYAEFLYTNLTNWLRAEKAMAELIIGEVVVNKQAREDAERVSKKVVAKLSKSLGGIGNKPPKFVDCRAKAAFERELYIVEGDSAAGACMQSRNGQFQAIMPVRGKIINCLKEDLGRILQSDIIIDLLQILGCGIEAETKNVYELPKFDLDKLNFGKVIICTDADTDGMQIRCLIITMIYRLCPSLLRKGKVFIAETPLFEITCDKETYFAYTEEEKESTVQKLTNLGYGANKIKMQRSKGLGENDPAMMSISTMAPETRRLIQVDLAAGDETARLTFNALLGDDIEMRRMLVKQYFSQTETYE